MSNIAIAFGTAIFLSVSFMASLDIAHSNGKRRAKEQIAQSCTRLDVVIIHDEKYSCTLLKDSQ